MKISFKPEDGQRVALVVNHGEAYLCTVDEDGFELVHVAGIANGIVTVYGNQHYEITIHSD